MAVSISRILLAACVSTIYASMAFGQDDGGMLCGSEDQIPVWVLRFEIIDYDTHLPIPFATIKTVDDGEGTISWETNRDGIGVLVATTESCLPSQGALEITAEDYRYHSEQINRDYFEENEDDKRIFLEGHRHNWTDMNQIPSTKELIDKVIAKRYEVGVKRIDSGMGFVLPNYAPACFEYKIELERIGDEHPHRDYNGHDLMDNHDTSNEDSQIPTVTYDGEIIYVFPNDLSMGAYHWVEANNACDCLNRLGHDDWYLPSKEELNILYENKDEIGGFAHGWYWSSTASSLREYWAQSFDDGEQDTEFKGTSYDVHKGGMRVRCIRKK